MRYQFESAANSTCAPWEIRVGELGNLVVYMLAKTGSSLRTLTGDKARDVIQISKVTCCPDYGLHIISRPNLSALEFPPIRLANRLG